MLLSTLIATLLASAPASAVQTQASHDHAAHRQAEIAARGAAVMSFDLNRTLHRFVPNERGGVQSVVSTDGDSAQVMLVREHLRSEAGRFARGDFSSPSAIHGADMPGLAELAGARGAVAIEYADTAAGGEIRFRTIEPKFVKAVHAWFAAQLRDHGRHATQGHAH
jgi:hypothetical protein